MKFVDICVVPWIYSNASKSFFFCNFLISQAIYIKWEETTFFRVDSSSRFQCDVYSALNEDNRIKKYYIAWNWHSITEICSKQIIQMSHRFYSWFLLCKRTDNSHGQNWKEGTLVFTCLIVNLANLNYWPNPTYILSPIHLSHSTFSCKYITMPQTLRISTQSYMDSLCGGLGW